MLPFWSKSAGHASSPLSQMSRVPLPLPSTAQPAAISLNCACPRFRWRRSGGRGCTRPPSRSYAL